MPPNKKIKLHRPWQDVAKEAQDYRDASIAQVIPGLPAAFEDIQFSEALPISSMDVCGKALHPRDYRITQHLPEELIKMLAEGELTAVDVTTAFLRRARLAQKLTNCITELLPERALNRAKYLDEYYQKNKRPIGPLHGLPISVKEMMGMEGLGLNGGFIAWWDRKAKEDAHVLQILWSAGAVFHARTTEPQTMMHLETDSNLYGVTVNPYNRNIAAGGSSGGEGALIGLRGSCLGIGTDIGGSIRSPAANCGIYGFKPTGSRTPTDGWCSTAAGAEPIPCVVGPMSTSIEGLKIFMRAVLAAKPWLEEPELVPIPWQWPIINPQVKPLKIAVMWNDGVVTPHPPIIRAMKEIVDRLKSIDNVEVVDWKPYLQDEAWAIISSLYYPDGGSEAATVIAESGEPWLPLSNWIIKENPCAKKLTPHKMYYWLEEREAYRKEYAKVWNDTATGRNDVGQLEGIVDVILCPVGPGVAPKHNTAKYWGYTSQWNLLDYPAVVFPVSKVDKKRDILDETFKPMTDIDEENQKLYDPDMFDGLPISLQLVGRRFDDEKVLAILEYLKGKTNLPLVPFP
ncbi:amidase signature domain-containing protein [Tricladium varicosporioides]|nr:amidase signature domain-containing protein [Hymenoscyphus varicosporioides]